MSTIFKEQLESVIRDYDSAIKNASYDDASDVLDSTEVSNLRTQCIAAIERASGSNSTYRRRINEISISKINDYYYLKKEIGVAKALLSDINNNYMQSFEEILHSDMFGNFLEMATHLLENGYKDPAAVLAGSSLEIHIKHLCMKNNVNTLRNGKPIKTEPLNSELKKEGVYTNLDQKNITAWLDLRNKAAHGNYNEYSEEQVRLLISSVQDFITRYPA